MQAVQQSYQQYDHDVQECMSSAKLKLSPYITKFVICGSQVQHKKLDSFFPENILGSLLHPAEKFGSPGILFVSHFSFADHVSNGCKNYFTVT